MAARIRRRLDCFGRPDLSSQRRPRFKAVLGPLGLWEAFACLPRESQEHFWRCKWPDPVLHFHDSFPNGREHRELRRTVEAGFRDAAIDVDGIRMSVRDFFAVITGCMLVVRHTRLPGQSKEVLRFVRDAGPRLERWHAEHLLSAIQAMHRGAMEPLLAHSRLDARLLTATLDLQPVAWSKAQPRLIIGCTPPQVRNVRLDGASRPMYRVAATTGPDGIRWGSWTGAQLGRADAQHEYPVYVQSHALRHLRQRINFPPMAPYVEAWLAESLAEPLIVDRHDNDLLVEYRVQEHRLGYLVVTLLDDLVAVRTFKFLTMSNTPEARQLERQLRLTRREVDWLGLHELAAFTQTDLSRDPLLREMLEACGCGHLFSLNDADYAPEPKALAAELRRYLRLAA